MPADAGLGVRKLKITADWLLLVEGRDEANVFDALLKHCLDEGPKPVMSMG